jgi:hypothetical protein
MVDNQEPEPRAETQQNKSVFFGRAIRLVDQFQVDCPTCGRDSDAPETSFLTGPVDPVRETAFLLCRLKCEGCGTGFARVLWPMEPTDVPGFPERDKSEEEVAGLLARYEVLEAGYRQEWEALYTVASNEPFGTRGIDLAECLSVAPRPGRPTATDPRLLAAARAARGCALAHPGLNPVGMLWAGVFKCCVGLDLHRNAVGHRLLHVSISQSLALGFPSQLEAGFLTSLYYAPDELSRLRCAGGTQWPIFHYWLPWPMVDNADA